jgi:glycosyltransferase involved in cell wall biosynthesis
MRGAPLSFAAQDASLMQGDYALLLATSSVDLCTVQSLYPSLRDTFSLLYFHENQFAYPRAHQPQSVVDWQMVSVYSAMRADGLLFNSDFNRSSFLTGVERLLKKLPDLVPSNLVSELESKSQLLPVPISDVKPVIKTENSTVRLLWNHRWEWDKQPERLLAFVKKLKQAKVKFSLTLTGQSFRRRPPAFDELLEMHADVIEHAGFIENREDYENILAKADIVVSTAIHEFQGISVMEAVAHGCTPLLPNDLSYPEYFGTDFLYDVETNLDKTAAHMVKQILRWSQHGRPKAPDLTAYMESNLVSRYQEALQAS